MWADKALAQNRRFAVALRVLIVALVKTGETARATQIARELLKVDPEFSISGFLSRIPFPVQSMSATYRRNPEGGRRPGLTAVRSKFPRALQRFTARRATPERAEPAIRRPENWRPRR